ncbi:Oligopeptide-binding protein OppA [bacterium HR29]|jgi:oligopeptide transport system substrate-binding protein|nr:Oligopeptide-binding protein OppA [bacterium HR29]
MEKFNWRALLGLFALAAVVLAAACGDDEEGGGPGGEAEQPRQGGEIVVQYLEFQSFDPHFSSFAQDIGHQTFVFRGLYKLNKDNEPVPEMAADMPQISADGKTYTVKIKPGLKWSDGDDLKAEDFVAGIERTCNPDNAGEYQYLLSNIVGCDDYYAATDKSAAEKAALRAKLGVRAIDDTTIEFKLQQPQPTFTTILTMWMTWPVPIHIVPDGSTPWPEDPTKLAFNGPFVVSEYVPKERMVFTRNPNYAGQPAYLDKITFRYIEDNVQSNNAFRAGELHMALADATNLKALQQEFPDKLLSYVTPTTIGLEMQLKKKPLDNLNVRLALSRAIDRKALAENVLQGAVTPTTTWVPPEVLGLDPNATDLFEEQIGFNPEKAKEALAAAGYPNGQGFPTLSILIRDSAGARATAEFLKEQFKTILNIDVNIEIVDAPTRSKRFTEGQFELFPGGWHQDYPDPENWIIGLFDTGGTLNNYNCSDPEIDDLISKARYNTNDQERREQYKKVNELISTRICGVAPMYHSLNHVLIDPRLKGVRENATSQDRVLAGDWAPELWWLSE